MPSFSKAAVEDIVAGLTLEESNRAFVAHWLSLWNGDALPPSSRFKPSALRGILPSLLKFEVVPDRRVTVRLAGTGYAYVFKKDPTGTDWIEAAPVTHRATRLKVFSAIARGAILVAHRRIGMLSGEDFISEEVFFPFAPDAGGAVAVLGRVNFTPGQFVRIRSVAQVTGDPLDHRLVPFPAAQT
ncbi:MAG: PAS domain-containing protein [Rhizomicrobium sp.]